MSKFHVEIEKEYGQWCAYVVSDKGNTIAGSGSDSGWSGSDGAVRKLRAMVERKWQGLFELVDWNDIKDITKPYSGKAPSLEDIDGTGPREAKANG